MRNFRPIDEDEKAMIRRLAEKGLVSLPEPVRLAYDDGACNLEVAYVPQQGGFLACCVMVLTNETPDLVLLGASRRSRKDRFNPIKGRMLAFRRALTSGAVQYGRDTLEEERAHDLGLYD